jgi:hypothetical protein
MNEDCIQALATMIRGARRFVDAERESTSDPIVTLIRQAVASHLQGDTETRDLALQGIRDRGIGLRLEDVSRAALGDVKHGQSSGSRCRAKGGRHA